MRSAFSKNERERQQVITEARKAQRNDPEFAEQMR